VLARSYEHLVGAFGVVGSSGVKERPKSVLIADALASAWLIPGVVLPAVQTVGSWCADGGQTVCTGRCPWTNTGQILDVYWTKTGHPPGLLTRDANA
jgi:hypothetical protein